MRRPGRTACSPIPLAAVVAGLIASEWRSRRCVAAARAVVRPQRLRRRRPAAAPRRRLLRLLAAAVRADGALAARRGRDGSGRRGRRVLRRRWAAAGTHTPARAGRARAGRDGMAVPARPVRAWRCRTRDRPCPGASYTDVHVRLPARRALVVLSLAGAAVCLYGAWRRVLRVPVVAVGALAVVAIAGQSVLPGLLERLDVAPQELSRERPYLADAIASTRRAFALDDVSVRPIRGGGGLSAADIAASRRTIDNVPLWDADVLTPTINELQSIGRYYSFPSTTVDRYMVDGVPTLMTVAARQLDRGRLDQDARSWANDRFAYTHGYGVVAVKRARSTPPDTRASRRRTSARRGTRSACASRASTSANSPTQTRRTWSCGRGRGEVDEPVPGSSAARVPLRRDRRGRALEHAAQGRVRRPLRRPQAAADRDARLALADRAAPRRERAAARAGAVPALGRATSRRRSSTGACSSSSTATRRASDYPYSAPVRMGDERVNYVRASALAAIDAFSGRVSLYATDAGDPILRAWRATYPGLFLPAARMPDRAARAPPLPASAVRRPDRGVRDAITPATRPGSGTARTHGSARCSSPGRSKAPARSTSPTRDARQRATRDASRTTCSRGSRATRSSA